MKLINKSLKYYLILAVSAASIAQMHAMNASYKLITPALGAAGIFVPLYALTKIKEQYGLQDHKKEAMNPEDDAVKLFLATFAAGSVAAGLSLSAVPGLIGLGGLSAGIYGVDKLFPEYKVADTLVSYADAGITTLKNDFNSDNKPEITVIADTIKPIQAILDSTPKPVIKPTIFDPFGKDQLTAKRRQALEKIMPTRKAVQPPAIKRHLKNIMKDSFPKLPQAQQASPAVNIPKSDIKAIQFSSIDFADPANKSILQKMIQAQKGGAVKKEPVIRPVQTSSHSSNDSDQNESSYGWVPVVVMAILAGFASR